MNQLFQRLTNEGYTEDEAETLIAEIEDHRRQDRLDREGELRYTTQNKEDNQ